MSQICRSQIIEVLHLNDRYSCLQIYAPQIAETAQAGQFVNLQVGEDGSIDPLLKRPFSIHRIDRELGMIYLLIKVVGVGTEKLQKMKAGQGLEMIGPLGHGFRLQNTGKALLVAGGIGIAPLYELAVQLSESGVEVTVLLGVTDQKDLILSTVMEEYDPQIIMVNPGVSSQRKGLVTELAAECLSSKEYDQIYVCGPEPMLKALHQQLGSNLINSQFSLEERMGCGVGLCFSCVCKVKQDDGTGEWKHERVCTCGPVFMGNEVVF